MMKIRIQSKLVVKSVVAIAGLAAIMLVGLADAPSPTFVAHAQTAPPAVATVNTACVIPQAATTPAPTTDEAKAKLAWQIFVAMNCSSGTTNRPLVWETWSEQFCLQNPTNPVCQAGVATTAGGAAAMRPRLFKGGKQVKASAMRAMTAQGKREIVSECAPFFNAKNPRPSSLSPYVAKLNLTSDAQVCEEVFVNPTEASFVQANNLGSLQGQGQYIGGLGGKSLQLPRDSIEVKADWIPVKYLKGATPTPFSCTNPPPGVYTETISSVQGKKTVSDCYALVGMHISSKLSPNWLWATFEPQSMVTNPNRCNPNLYSQCTDPWGSVPAVSTGQTTAASPALAALFKQAGLPAALQNYRLVGAITDFVDTEGNPRLLGNSFVEMSAGVPALQASCITCHAYAQINMATNPPVANPNVGPYPISPPGNTGTPLYPVVMPGAGWQSVDFSYFLMFMPSKPPAKAMTANKK
jgi:hypothetical protein